jgi:hypothetical protein
MGNSAFKCNEGESGFVHTFNVKEEDGTNSDITWATGTRLVIIDEGAGTTNLDITTNMAIVPNNLVQWTVQSGETDFYGDNLTAVLHFTAPGRVEKTYDFPAIITKKKV